MINRILIRMKVVQMLYSYLLTRGHFNVMPQPEAPSSRDKRFAYKVYCDLLLLLLDQAGYRFIHLDNTVRIEPASHTDIPAKMARGAAALAVSEDMRDIAHLNAAFLDALAPVSANLASAVKDAAIFKEYRRKRSEIDIREETTMWKVLMSTVMLRHPDVVAIFEADPEFTHVGLKQGIRMFEDTLDEFADVRGSLVESRKSLVDSLDKAYELYHSLLQLMVDLTHVREMQLEEAKHKYLPTHDDLNPDTRFIDNAFIRTLKENEDLAGYAKNTPVSWLDDEIMLRHLLDKILASDIYKNYMAMPAPDFAADCELWHQLFKHVIADSDELAEALEAKSIYWNDDLAIMGSFVLKTVKYFARGSESDARKVHLLPKYKDLEDEQFGPRLFEAAIRNQDAYRAMIDCRLTSGSWDPERLAFMDIVIMETAIAELLNFESIPTVVTVNEYTEIANYYSTPKSGQFVTGMLYAIINNLKSEGKIVKE